MRKKRPQKTTKPRTRRPHTRKWGEWEDEEVPKRGLRQMTPLERVLK